MQLGITIPLQKHLKMKQPPYGEPMDLFFCWELHMIRFMGKRALVMVNANNRFFVLFTGMKAADWKMLPERAEEAIKKGLQSEGYMAKQVNDYFNLAGFETCGHPCEFLKEDMKRAGILKRGKLQ